MFGVLKLGKLGASMKRAGLNPRTLFSASEPGVWYDPSDMSTLFQDSAGTTPVTAVEQPVGRILDKSGRGNHASQTTTTKRPVLKIDAGGCYYLSFDGVDDALQTGNIDFTGTDKMTVWAGVTKLSDTARGCIVEFGNGSVDTSSIMYLNGPGASGGSPKFSFAAVGPVSTASIASTDAANLSAPSAAVMCGLYVPGTSSKLRVNGVQTAAGDINPPGNFYTRPLYIGARNQSNLYFNGRLYGLVMRGGATGMATVEAVERYMNSKTRAY